MHSKLSAKGIPSSRESSICHIFTFFFIFINMAITTFELGPEMSSLVKIQTLYFSSLVGVVFMLIIKT